MYIKKNQRAEGFSLKITLDKIKSIQPIKGNL